MTIIESEKLEQSRPTYFLRYSLFPPSQMPLIAEEKALSFDLPASITPEVGTSELSQPPPPPPPLLNLPSLPPLLPLLLLNSTQFWLQRPIQSAQNPSVCLLPHAAQPAILLRKALLSKPSRPSIALGLGEWRCTFTFTDLEMNPTATSRVWSPIVSAPGDEFTDLFDFGDLSFPTFDGLPQNDADLLQHNGAGAMDTAMDGPAGLLGPEHGNMQQQVDQRSAAPSLNGFEGSTESFPDLAMQSELFDQHQQQQMHMQNQRYHAQHAIPPTPNSIEMHNGHPQYYRTPTDHQQLHMYNQYRRHQKDQVGTKREGTKNCRYTDVLQMIFTPLVSPAVTPLDTQFKYPEYAAPMEAFSPLTSPALRAQSQNHAAQRSVYAAVRGSDTSDTTSPIDPTIDHFAPQSASTPAPLRKSKRKTSSNSTKNPARAVRKSPAMKPQRKKQPSSTVIPAKEVSGIIAEARKSNKSQSGEARRSMPYSQDSSGPDSVSPEPLSEILMPPPATPRSNSAGKSPYLDAKQGQAPDPPVQDVDGEPATPASLMKIRKQNKNVDGSNRQPSSLKAQTAAVEADMQQIMEDIVLPAPANTTKKPNLRPINTTSANTEHSTPMIATKKTPKYGPASAPVTAATSALPSPQPGSATSPGGAEASKRGEVKLKGRDPRKRNSQSSVQVSPALRPKISPSIKPLLPEGGQYHSVQSC